MRIERIEVFGYDLHYIHGTYVMSGGRGDSLGKATGQPVATLLGGRRQERFPLYIAVPLGGAEEMAHYVLDRRAEGIHRFQLKLGGRPSDDAERVRRVVEGTDDEDIIIADANGGGGGGGGTGSARPP